METRFARLDRQTGDIADIKTGVWNVNHTVAMMPGALLGINKE